MSATVWLRTIKESLKMCGPVPDNSVPTLSGGNNFQGTISEPFDIPDPQVYPTYGISKSYSERAQDIITTQLLCRPDPSVAALRKRLGLD